ncbi:MAG: hypothetical protein AAF548_02205 [Actinomycetota bacterium]
MGLFSRKKREHTDDPTLADTEAEGPMDHIDDDAGSSDLGERAASKARAAFAELVDREFERLAHAGTWWTGGERLAIAADARRALAGEPLSGILPPPVEDATRRVAAAPATIRGTDVARWELDGLDSFAYVELVGVISRLIAIDTASYGLDIDLRDLPAAAGGEPTKTAPDDAQITTGWAPTIGPASAPSSLSAVPPEADAMFDLHGVLYTSLDGMFDMQLVRDGLTRPQIELVAARTSSLNDCFY